MRALRFLLRKEFLQITRDRVMLRIIFVLPLIQLLLLAQAVTFDVRSVRLAVVDLDRSSSSRGVTERLAASGRFIPRPAASVASADRAMLARDTDGILVIPADFERDLVRWRRAPVELILNAEDGAAAVVVQSYAGNILQRYARELEHLLPPLPAPFNAAHSALPATTGSAAPSAVQAAARFAQIDIRTRGRYNPELDYGDYMVPGILVVLVTMIGTLLTAMNIVREKEMGTLEQLNVTPLSRSVFIAAKLIPLWVFAMIDLALGLLLAHLLLDVPVHGSLLLVFVAAAVYLVVALGVGLWISTVAETQQQAMFVAYSLLLVYLLMSGLFTPVRSMPEWAQWLTVVNPVAHYVELMRAVLLKGAGVRDVARELSIMAASGVVVLTLAVRRYRKRSG